MRKTVNLAVLGFVVALAGCSETNREDAINSQVVSTNQTVDAFSLSEASFEAFLISINRTHLSGEPRVRLREEWRRKTLFAQKAREAGLDRDSTHQAKLAQFQREALAQLYVDKELEKRLSDTTLKTLYEDRKSALATDEIHLAARFFPVENSQDLQASLTAKNQADAVLLAVNSGEAFLPEEITSQNAGSVSNPSVDRSGNLGWMPVVHAQSRFGIDLSNPKDGEIIGPLYVTRGWYVLQVVENTRKKIPEFERVRRQLMEQERQRIVGELAEELLSAP